MESIVNKVTEVLTKYAESNDEAFGSGDQAIGVYEDGVMLIELDNGDLKVKAIIAKPMQFEGKILGEDNDTDDSDDDTDCDDADDDD